MSTINLGWHFIWVHGIILPTLFHSSFYSTVQFILYRSVNSDIHEQFDSLVIYVYDRFEEA